MLLVGFGSRWRPQLALRSWWERRRPVATATPVLAARLGTGRAGSRVIRALVDFDLKRLGLSPLTVLMTGLVVLAWLAIMGDSPETHFNLVTGMGTMWVGLMLIPVFELLASRDRKHELLASLPTPRQRRTLGLAALALVPAAVVYAATFLGLLWMQHKNLSLPRNPQWYELGLAALVVLGGALIGIVAGRWLTSHLGMPVFIVAMVAWVVAFGGTDHHRFLSTAPELANYRDSDSEPLTMLAGSTGWHAVYILGLCGLALAGATLFERRRWRWPTVLGVVALAVTVVGAVIQQP
jgi:hypothetical protein